MGYDMYWLKEPEGQAEVLEAARAVWNAAIEARNALPREEMGAFIGGDRCRELALDWDAHEAYAGRTARYIAAQDQVMAASAEVDRAHRSYFRLNIHGMSIYRDLMGEFGMAFEDIPHPAWPETEDYGITAEQFWAIEDPEEYPEVFAAMTPGVAEKARTYSAAHQEILAWHGKADTPGIPFHKFSSNDAWVVLPAECEAAARAWEIAVEERGEDQALAIVSDQARGADYWLAWIEYLRGAARHGGFEVR